MKLKFIAAFTAVALFSTACFGSFAATYGLYNWNKSFSGKWTQTLMFWVLSIIPVYGLFTFADVWIFNLIEFWSGSNPLSSVERVDEGKILVHAEDATYSMVAVNDNEFNVYKDDALIGRGTVNEAGDISLYNFETGADKSFNLTETSAVTM